jgi:hypothetical protein
VFARHDSNQTFHLIARFRYNTQKIFLWKKVLRLSTIEIRPVRPADTYELRHRILRPHQSLSACAYPYDTAVQEDVRGTGAGGKILQALIDAALTQSLPAEIWCNGRANVKGFYEHFGFVQEGDLFDLPDIGPHILLIKTLHPARS